MPLSLGSWNRATQKMIFSPLVPSYVANGEWKSWSEWEGCPSSIGPVIATASLLH